MKLHLLDALVIAAYFALTLAIGLQFSRRNRDTEKYFLGGRSFPGWAMGLSLVGAMISSVTFIAYPADSYKTAWVRFIPNLALPLVIALAAWLLVPFFRRGTVTSAYEYLARRFGPAVSVYAAVVFLLGQVLRNATVTYLLAILLAEMTGLTVAGSILLAGGVTAIYTIKGGFSAVVWTDVIQTIVLVTGAVVCLAVAIVALPGGVGQIIAEATAAGKLSFMDLNTATGNLEPIPTRFTLSEKTTVMLFFAGVINYLTGTIDQTTVQRWCAARSAREARKSMVIVAVCGLPIWAAFLFLGTTLWVYFQHHPTAVSVAALSGAAKAEQILPHYIMTVLPHGLAGLVIAAALAAAMSTLSSSISASAMVWIRDVYQIHLARDRDDQHYLHAGFLTSLVVSVLMMVGAWLFHISDAKTLSDLGWIVTALFGGGISGTFILGMFTRIGDARAVVFGIVLTAIFTAYALLCQFKVLPAVFDPYYTSILGNLVMFVSACAYAGLRPPAKRDLTNLTIWDQSRTPLV